MFMADYGMLIPTGGGEDVPLKKGTILIGRRETCDIVLRFPNVSGQHCKLTLESGYWFVTDLNSSNGTKLNGTKIAGKRRLDPGAILAVAKHQYEVQYDPESLGASGAPPADEDAIETLMKSSLMQRAGLDRRSEDDIPRKKNLDEDI
jgi:pSer/pThr/pTyr-binding forkhead associated (FHA) protein